MHMFVDRSLAERMRLTIDAALERARTEWEGPSVGDHPGTVVLAAAFDEIEIRITARAQVALERAEELAGAGWTVDLRDADDHPLDRIANGVRRRPVDARPPFEARLPADAVLPEPAIASVDRLRDTA